MESQTGLFRAVKKLGWESSRLETYSLSNYAARRAPKGSTISFQEGYVGFGGIRFTVYRGVHDGSIET